MDTTVEPTVVDGRNLSISTAAFKRGESSSVDRDAACEEVATILAGSFLVEAEDERYELSPGEGIIIPPRMARVWTCQSDEGTLYRVTVKSPLGAA